MFANIIDRELSEKHFVTETWGKYFITPKIFNTEFLTPIFTFFNTKFFNTDFFFKKLIKSVLKNFSVRKCQC